MQPQQQRQNNTVQEHYNNPQAVAVQPHHIKLQVPVATQHHHNNQQQPVQYTPKPQTQPNPNTFQILPKQFCKEFLQKYNQQKQYQSNNDKNNTIYTYPQWIITKNTMFHI